MLAEWTEHEVEKNTFSQPNINFFCRETSLCNMTKMRGIILGCVSTHSAAVVQLVLLMLMGSRVSTDSGSHSGTTKGHLVQKVQLMPAQCAGCGSTELCNDGGRNRCRAYPRATTFTLSP